MKFVRAAVTTVLLVLTGCDGGGGPAPVATPTPSTRPEPGSTTAPGTTAPPSSPSPPTTGAGAHHLPRLTLVANMAEPPAPWTPVMFVPFGEGNQQVGALLKKTEASQPVVPPSFAIDRDGSLWMLDLVKRRIVHYDSTGRLLDVVGGLEFNRFQPYAQDLGFVGDQLYVQEFAHTSLQAFVRTVDVEGIGPRLRVEWHGEPIVLAHLVSPQPELLGFSDGTSGVDGSPPSGGNLGYQLIDPQTGAAETVLGALLVDGTRLGLGPESEEESATVLLHHEADGADSQRNVRLVVTPSAEGSVHLRAVVAWQPFASLPHGFAARVIFSPSRLVDQKRYHGSTKWLFEYFDDGQPLVWEPIPESPLVGAYVWRYLAQGLDGHLYLMLAEKGGMRICRRPGPPAG